MKILAFSGSNSSSSINRKLLQYTVSFFTNDEVKNEPTEEKREFASPLQNKVTKGLSNPFAGTSWGN